MSSYRILVSASIACTLAACSGDRCLVYDYGPPSARIAIRDADTGESLCSGQNYIVDTNRGRAIAHEDLCEWWLPAWTPGGEAGATADEASLVVTVTGYESAPLLIGIQRNECSEVLEPPLVQLDVAPAPPEE